MSRACRMGGCCTHDSLRCSIPATHSLTRLSHHSLTVMLSCPCRTNKRKCSDNESRGDMFCVVQACDVFRSTLLCTTHHAEARIHQARSPNTRKRRSHQPHSQQMLSHQPCTHHAVSPKEPSAVDSECDEEPCMPSGPPSSQSLFAEPLPELTSSLLCRQLVADLQSLSANPSGASRVTRTSCSTHLEHLGRSLPHYSLESPGYDIGRCSC